MLTLLFIALYLESLDFRCCGVSDDDWVHVCKSQTTVIKRINNCNFENKQISWIRWHAYVHRARMGGHKRLNNLKFEFHFLLLSSLVSFLRVAQLRCNHCVHNENYCFALHSTMCTHKLSEIVIASISFNSTLCVHT